MTTKSNGKGQRIVRLTPEFLQDVMVNGANFETNLPEDSRLLSIQFSDTSRWEMWMLFESVEWESLQEGEEIPFIDVKIEKNPENKRMYFLDEESFKYE